MQDMTSHSIFSEDSCLLGCDSVSLVGMFLMFWRKVQWSYPRRPDSLSACCVAYGVFVGCAETKHKVGHKIKDFPS